VQHPTSVEVSLFMGRSTPHLEDNGNRHTKNQLDPFSHRQIHRYATRGVSQTVTTVSWKWQPDCN